MALKKVAYDKSKILRVTREGLEYLDDQGIKCAIDFHTCQQNVQVEWGSPRWMMESKEVYVGFRDFGAKPPHFTFAGDPQIRFEFPMPKPGVVVPGKQKFIQRDPQDFRGFREFQKRLFDAGVQTLDMA